jgi:hypothetical protein
VLAHEIPFLSAFLNIGTIRQSVRKTARRAKLAGEICRDFIALANRMFS